MTRTRWRRLRAGGVALFAMVAPVAVGAVGQNEFVPVGSLPNQESLPAAPLVFAAYAFVWVALVAYVFLLWRRVAKVERELADVNARLKAGRRP